MVQVVIPMAGMGTRFSSVGYEVPKPLIPVHSQPMFKLVMANLYSSEVSRFVMVSQREWQLGSWVDDLSGSLGVPVRIVEIDYVTSGPADTVELAIPHLDLSMPVVVANSDQYVEMNISSLYRPLLSEEVDGVVLTMEDDDPKWSYVAVAEDGHVAEIREKEVISSLATVGIYGFRSGQVMTEAIRAMKKDQATVNGEYYVGPAYNYLVSRGGVVQHLNLGPVSGCMFGMGIPEDYEYFVTTSVSRVAARKTEHLFSER